MTPEEAKEKIGESNVDEMNKLNDGPVSATTGIWYSHTYERSHPKKFKKEWRGGKAPEEFFEKKGWIDFELKPGLSAAAGIRSFFKGLTICECLSAIVAIEYKTILKTVGEEKFDKAFGSTDGGQRKRLRIATNISRDNPLRDFLSATDAAKNGDTGSENKRPAEKGEWYYIYNHPKYLLKHPGGAYQGENCFYMGKKDGKQYWRGFGVDNVTESEMLKVMASDYNRRRDSHDKRAMREHQKSGVDMSLFDIDDNNLKNKVTPQDILNDPEYRSPIDGVSRKGGFVASVGTKLDEQAVANLANS